jgi:hypothetical protein
MLTLYQKVIKNYDYYNLNGSSMTSGQRWFVSLNDANPALAKMITGNKDLDTFDNNMNIPKFIDWLINQSIQT